MKENNNIPEPEIFTSEIEDTIDDLFKPSKKIEIDPLTQEVKELDKEQGDIPVEFELAEEGESPVQQTAKTEETDKTGSQAAPKEEETLLELDLEFEMEDQPSGEAEKGKTKTEGASGGAEQPAAIEERLEQLKQQIFTIEWEVTEPQIHQTVALISGLRTAPELNGQPQARSMVELMEKVLQNIQYHPEKVPATAPAILKKITQYLFDLLTGKEISSEQGDKLIRELKALIEKPEEPEEETILEQLLVLNEEAEPAPEAQKKPEEPEVAEAVAGKKEEEEKTADMEPADTFASDEGRRLIKAHLAELQRCINRIEPLEKLLSKTPGMEKLYTFQHGIRQRLEGQVRELSGFFFKDMELDLPRPAPAKKDSEDYAKAMNLSGCPWQELLTINIDDMEIGFPADQVVYMSGPPWHSKSAIKKGGAIPLRKLKPWPWSKLNTLFRGRLANLDDSVLSSMQFPVIQELGDRELAVPSSFLVILLFDGRKGAAILAEEKPIRIEIPADAQWTEEQTAGFEAEVNTHGNKIKVVTIDSLNRV